MRILVAGARGFVGKNLCRALKNIRDGKDRSHPELAVDELFEYDLDSTPAQLDKWCREADFVFNLAGVNRPKDAEDFMAANFGFAGILLDMLRKHGNRCPVMLSSSQQASLAGRFGDSEYGRSKRAGEDLFLQYGEESGSRVLVYRFPNIFGKWCRPNYNSAVATFCNAIANDLPYTVSDPCVELELLYIDDLVDEMMAALEGREHRCAFDGLAVIPAAGPEAPGRYCYCPVTHRVSLGRIVELLKSFAEQPKTLLIPDISPGSFTKKLYSTYLSYLPYEKAAFPLRMNMDERGSFTELLHSRGAGQVSVNISKPGVTKGQHWHQSKWEQFIVVKGHGLIQQRNIDDPDGKILEWEVDGDHIRAVHMLPGYTHSIINLSDSEDMVTVMYCNEIFDRNRADTYSEAVDPEC